MNALETKATIDALVRHLLDRLPPDGMPAVEIAKNASAEGIVTTTLEVYGPLFVLEGLGFVRSTPFGLVTPGRRFEQVKNARAAYRGRFS